MEKLETCNKNVRKFIDGESNMGQTAHRGIFVRFLAFSLGKYVPFTECEFFGPGAGASFLITHKGARAPASKRPEPGEPD